MGGLIYSKTYQVSVHMSLQPFASNRSPMNKKYNTVLLLSPPPFAQAGVYRFPKESRREHNTKRQNSRGRIIRSD